MDDMPSPSFPGFFRLFLFLFCRDLYRGDNERLVPGVQCRIFGWQHMKPVETMVSNGCLRIVSVD